MVCREAWSADGSTMRKVVSGARLLPLAGGFAAVLLLLVIAIDGATRPGYDAWHHGVSQLVLGELGWLERLVYVFCGLLTVGLAVRARQLLASGPGAKWGPRFLAAVGVGLVVAGVFPTDPALGYPVGEPTTVSTAGRLHQFGGTLLFVGLVGACLALSRRFARNGRTGWRVYSAATGVLVLGSALAAGIVYRLETVGVLTFGPAGGLERIAFGVGFVWIAALAIQLARIPLPHSEIREGTDRP